VEGGFQASVAGIVDLVFLGGEDKSELAWRQQHWLASKPQMVNQAGKF
jgi:hypothetical protein